MVRFILYINLCPVTCTHTLIQYIICFQSSGAAGVQTNFVIGKVHTLVYESSPVCHRIHTYLLRSHINLISCKIHTERPTVSTCLSILATTIQQYDHSDVSSASSFHIPLSTQYHNVLFFYPQYGFASLVLSVQIATLKTCQISTNSQVSNL